MRRGEAERERKFLLILDSLIVCLERQVLYCTLTWLATERQPGCQRLKLQFRMENTPWSSVKCLARGGWASWRRTGPALQAELGPSVQALFSQAMRLFCPQQVQAEVSRQALPRCLLLCFAPGEAKIPGRDNNNVVA